jgi:hypothetical protein
VLPILSKQDAEDFDWLLKRDAQRRSGKPGDAGVPPFQFGKVHAGSAPALGWAPGFQVRAA